MDFLISEADEENASVQEEEDRDITPTVSDNEFIDDADFDDILAADYAAFENVTRHYNDSINDALSDFDYEQEPNITVMTMMKLNYRLMNLKIIRKKLNLPRNS